MKGEEFFPLLKTMITLICFSFSAVSVSGSNVNFITTIFGPVIRNFTIAILK